MIEEIFKVPLYGTKLELDNRGIIDYCNQYESKNEGQVVSNQGGYQSFDLPLEEFIFQPLVHELKKHSNILSNMFGMDGVQHISNMWFNINRYKDYNDPHNHPNCAFSGVYYVSIPNKGGNTVFENPLIDVMSFANYGLSFNKWNSYNSSIVWKKAKDNLLFIFPSWLKHRVDPNYSNEDRISISFNTVI